MANHALKRNATDRPRRPSSAGPSAHFALTGRTGQASKLTASAGIFSKKWTGIKAAIKGSLEELAEDLDRHQSLKQGLTYSEFTGANNSILINTQPFELPADDGHADLDIHRPTQLNSHANLDSHQKRRRPGRSHTVRGPKHRKSRSRRYPRNRLQWRQRKRSYALCLQVAALNPAASAFHFAPVKGVLWSESRDSCAGRRRHTSSTGGWPILY